MLCCFHSSEDNTHFRKKDTGEKGTDSKEVIVGHREAGVGLPLRRKKAGRSGERPEGGIGTYHVLRSLIDPRR